MKGARYNCMCNGLRVNFFIVNVKSTRAIHNRLQEFLWKMNCVRVSVCLHFCEINFGVFWIFYGIYWLNLNIKKNYSHVVVCVVLLGVWGNHADVSDIFVGSLNIHIFDCYAFGMVKHRQFNWKFQSKNQELHVIVLTLNWCMNEWCDE